MAELDLKNYLKLEVLMVEACRILRDLFRERWQVIYNTEWNDDVECRSALIKGRTKEIYKKARKGQKRALEEGNIENFDVTTLCQLLSALKISTANEKLVQGKIQEIVEVRNKLAHHPSKVIGDEDFKLHWQKLSNALMFFGIDNQKLNEICWSNSIAGINLAGPKEEDSANIVIAEELKEKANKAFKSQKMSEAIKLYSQALRLPKLSDKLQAALYSNISNAYLNLPRTDDNIRSARQDAKQTIICQPTWWKSHYRLGCAYEANQKYEKAIIAFETALNIDPSQSAVRNTRDGCRDSLATLRRKEHLDPLTSLRSRDEMYKQLDSNMTGKSLSKLMELERKSGKPDLVALADVSLAHHYVTGMENVPQDYKRAANLFAKAAAAGNAEGIYNLAMLTKKGLGVERDIPLTLTLLRKAANMPTMSPVIPNFPNVGVAEAQHALGLCYDDGVGVDVDLEMARMWYEKGSSNGCSNSSNNLGCLYMEGKGAAKNVDRAVQYWKLAASRGNVMAMDSLENYYIDIGNLTQAKHWWKCALDNGSVFSIAKEEFYSKIDDGMLEKHDSFKSFVENTLKEREENVKSDTTTSDSKCISKRRDDIFHFNDSSSASSLTDPNRINLIVTHRTEISRHKNHDTTRLLKTTKQPKSIQSMPFDLIGLKPINLSKMNIREDRVYEGHVMKVMSVARPIVGVYTSIHMQIVDENHEFQRCYIYNYPGSNDDLQRKFGFGAIFNIINPYLRIAQDFKPGIRVDDPKCILHLTTVDDDVAKLKRCRFCFTVGDNYKTCARCKKVYYCSKECQKKDWKLLKHDLVCAL